MFPILTVTILHTHLFPYDSVELSENREFIRIVDQTLLPGREVFLNINNPEQMYDAIYTLKVRGAPAIGVFAAFGLAICARNTEATSVEAFLDQIKVIKHYLASSRPTAVNLAHSLDRVEGVAFRAASDGAGVDEITRLMMTEAIEVKDEDIRRCLSIAQTGCALFNPGVRVLTHCNAGHLAVSRYGTALAPVYLAHSKSYAPKVYATETRPLLQGARLTCYELKRAGVDVTLVCDNMAASLMQSGLIDIVMVGADRIASNGDVANKIGTSMIAASAKYWNVPFWVLAPSSTIDMGCASGRDIVVEQRDPAEVTGTYLKDGVVTNGVEVYNPSFDITPRDLITGIITEDGVL